MEILTRTSRCWIRGTDPPEETPASQTKKGRGETEPTLLIIAFLPVPVHSWSKAFQQPCEQRNSVLMDFEQGINLTPTAWSVLGSGPVVQRFIDLVDGIVSLDPGRGRTQLSESRVPASSGPTPSIAPKNVPISVTPPSPERGANVTAPTRSTTSPSPSLSETQLPTLRRDVLHLRNQSPRSDRARYDKSIGLGRLAVARRLKAFTAIEGY